MTPTEIKNGLKEIAENSRSKGITLHDLEKRFIEEDRQINMFDGGGNANA